MKKLVIGYTQGTFDLLHYGHIKLFERAKRRCDYLIVGVNSDRLVKEYKGIKTSQDEKTRKHLVSLIKCVDKVVVVDSLDKVSKVKQFKFKKCFIGSDWKGNSRWKQTKKDLAKIGVEVIFLPHTDGISSSILREKNKKK